MTPQEHLLRKYYEGKTSLEEEKELKLLTKKSCIENLEQDVFAYYENEARVPKDLKDDLLAGIGSEYARKRNVKRRLYSLFSTAAMLLIVLSVYLDFRAKRQTQIADSFFVMEQALYQISESLQPPQEEEEMLILWVDDNVEIIIN